MRIASGYEDRKARLEMVPLIDVIFLLLVFFIYAMLSMTIHRGIIVDLPEIFNAKIDNRKNVAITITKENRLYVNKVETPIDDLINEIQRQNSLDDSIFIVNGDKKADLGIAIKVLDRLRTAGIDEVSFECTVEKP